MRTDHVVAGARRTIALPAAIAILVSNMIGTGVFTSLGLQVVGTHTGFALLALWALGGVVALCGAACYAELGAAMPRSGGEYVYLGEIFHPLIGFLGGWVSVTVGFAAAAALSGIAFGRYLAAVVPVPPAVGSLATLGVVTGVHAASLTLSRRFQVVTTALVVALIIAFIVAGFGYGHAEPVAFAPSVGAWREVGSPPFAVSLIYVSYAYSGWNAAGYVAGELRDPERTIPRALIVSAILVTVLYVLLNWTFLRTVPAGDLAGTIEVGARSATRMFGPIGGRIMSAVIALALLASMSGFVLAGSRVTQAMVADLPALASLARYSPTGVPRAAVLVQVGLTVVLLLSNAFELVLTYAGFTLELMTLFAIAALIVRRRRGTPTPPALQAWGYPATAFVYAAVSIWTLVFVIAQRPIAALGGAITLVLGVLLYAGLRAR